MSRLNRLDSSKAGMQGLDVDKINSLIADASRGSKFWEHQQKREREIEAKIGARSKQIEKLTQTEIDQATFNADNYLGQLETEFDLSTTIVHIDMDAFFAAVEMRDDPALKEKPMAVGSMQMLSTSNYPARRYGVRAAMPGFIAKRLCPQLLIIPANMEKYQQVGSQVNSILRQYDPNLVNVSIDEAYLNIDDYLQTSGLSSAASVASEIRDRIRHATNGLTASAGVACNRRLAKLCTDINKPDGQYILPSNDRQAIQNFIKTVKIGSVNGIGKVSSALLSAIDVSTCQEILEKRGLLYILEYPLTFKFLMQIAIGFDRNEMADSVRKTLGHELTFATTSDQSFLLEQIYDLSKSINERMVRSGLVANKVVLKLKMGDFSIISKTKSLTAYTEDASIISNEAASMLRYIFATKARQSVRLVGVRMGGLLDKASMPFLKYDISKNDQYASMSVTDESKSIVNVLSEESSAGRCLVVATDVESKPTTRQTCVSESSILEMLSEQSRNSLDFATSPVSTPKPRQTSDSSHGATSDDRFQVKRKLSSHSDAIRIDDDDRDDLFSECRIDETTLMTGMDKHHRASKWNAFAEKSRQHQTYVVHQRRGTSPGGLMSYDESTITATCPVCHKRILDMADIVSINNHIDDCLTTNMINNERTFPQAGKRPRKPSGLDRFLCRKSPDL